MKWEAVEVGVGGCGCFRRPSGAILFYIDFASRSESRRKILSAWHGPCRQVGSIVPHFYPASFCLYLSLSLSLCVCVFFSSFISRKSKQKKKQEDRNGFDGVATADSPSEVSTYLFLRSLSPIWSWFSSWTWEPPPTLFEPMKPTLLEMITIFFLPKSVCLELVWWDRIGLSLDSVDERTNEWMNEWTCRQVNRPLAMKKEGIQTRKRKPKNNSAGPEKSTNRSN